MPNAPKQYLNEMDDIVQNHNSALFNPYITNSTIQYNITLH